MAIERTARVAVPAASLALLWPAAWNGFPIVFADSGTYLSQAIDRYAGWDRPVFYSLLMLPLHLTVTLWPVIVAQALLAAWVLWVVCRVLVGRVSAVWFGLLVVGLSACSWLPWLVCELMPDLFTPLLVLVLALLAWVPERLGRGEQVGLAGLATLMIASQQSSLPLAGVILAVLVGVRYGLVRFYGASWPGERARERGLARLFMSGGAGVGKVVGGRAKPGHDTSVGRDTLVWRDTSVGRDTLVDRGPLGGRYTFAGGDRSAGPGAFLRAGWFRNWWLIVLPPALAVVGLCAVNLAAHGRFAVSPFGNIFLLARVIYDGPGMAALRRDCPAAHWLLCPFVDDFPPQSDDFLWTHDSPLNRAGGPKIVSREAGAIIAAALRDDPLGEARAALANTLEQMTLFASGDGLNPWVDQVSPVMARDFPAWERAAYAAARQQAGTLAVPPWLARLHAIVALAGVVACLLLVPVALCRGHASLGFLLAVLLSLPVGAAITGALSGPHDRYQARLMWLPPFVAVVSAVALRRRAA